jgi:pyruvate dehydrogenase E2 component (dihydrolipoamide acetyltransferase)
VPTFEQFRLPDAGEGLTEAEVVTWLVAAGDTVTVNQTIVEIETAKSLVELPSPYSGVVAEILVPVGTTVEVGTPIIVIDVDPGGAPAAGGAGGGAGGSVGRAGAPTDGPRPVAGPTAGTAAGPAGDGAAESPGSEGGATGGGGVGSAGGSDAGGAVLVGYGVSGHTAARRTRRVPGAPGPAAESAPAAPAASTPAASTAAAPGQGPAPAGTTSDTPRPTWHALAKPPVRKLAKDLHVDLDSVTATGPGGIVTREDVLAHGAETEPRTLATYEGDDAPWLTSGSVSDDGRETRVPVKSVRKRTAEAMVASAFTAPHVTVFHTVDVTRTMNLVARLREDREFADVRVTPLLITAKALMLAVRRHPEINASWDDASQEIVYKHYVNLGIAAATPRGLVVPNIKDAHRLGLHDLAEAIADLTATARAGRTTPTDMSGGTITITNVGVFGIDTGTPILNPGEAAILAFGAIREQPWVHKGKVKKRWVTQLALSFDHRLVDGGLGSRVLSDVAAVLGDPAQGLVWG